MVLQRNWVTMRVDGAERLVELDVGALRAAPARDAGVPGPAGALRPNRATQPTPAAIAATPCVTGSWTYKDDQSVTRVAPNYGVEVWDKDALGPDDLLASGVRRIVINFEETELINSIGISILLGVIESVNGAEGSLVLSNLNASNRELFEMLGLMSHVEMVETEELALIKLHAQI